MFGTRFDLLFCVVAFCHLSLNGIDATCNVDACNAGVTAGVAVCDVVTGVGAATLCVTSAGLLCPAAFAGAGALCSAAGGFKNFCNKCDSSEKVSLGNVMDKIDGLTKFVAGFERRLSSQLSRLEIMNYYTDDIRAVSTAIKLYGRIHTKDGIILTDTRRHKQSVEDFKTYMLDTERATVSENLLDMLTGRATLPSIFTVDKFKYGSCSGPGEQDYYEYFSKLIESSWLLYAIAREMDNDPISKKLISTWKENAKLAKAAYQNNRQPCEKSCYDDSDCKCEGHGDWTPYDGQKLPSTSTWRGKHVHCECCSNDWCHFC